MHRHGSKSAIRVTLTTSAIRKGLLHDCLDFLPSKIAPSLGSSLKVEPLRHMVGYMQITAETYSGIYLG